MSIINCKSVVVHGKAVRYEGTNAAEVLSLFPPEVSSRSEVFEDGRLHVFGRVPVLLPGYWVIQFADGTAELVVHTPGSFTTGN
jgi:hypothetical protein